MSPLEPVVTVKVPQPEPGVPNPPKEVAGPAKVQSNVTVAARAGTAIAVSVRRPASNADDLVSFDTLLYAFALPVNHVSKSPVLIALVLRTRDKRVTNLCHRVAAIHTATPLHRPASIAPGSRSEYFATLPCD